MEVEVGTAAQPAPWSNAPAPWQTPPPPPSTATKTRGAAGGILAALAAAAKYGAVALKLGKFGPMVVSMALSVGALTLLFGWRFGVGLLGLIFVHEMGHVLFAKAEGVKTTLPLFLGPLGALIFLRSQVRDARQEAVIAIGGPLVGTLGAIACALLAAGATGSTRLLLIALAYFGFFINLFNLTPLAPLDGGRITRSVPLWLLFTGLAAIGWVVWASAQWSQGVNPIVVIVLVIAAISAFQRLVRRREESPYVAAVPPSVRLGLGLGWIALIAITGVGMSLAHNELVTRGAISAPATDSGGGVQLTASSQLAADATRLDDDLTSVDDTCSASSSACAAVADSAAIDVASLTNDVAGSANLSAGADAARVRLNRELAGVSSRVASAQTAAASGDARDAALYAEDAQRVLDAAGPDLALVNAG